MTPHSQARTHAPAPVAARARRFSEGIERMPLAPSSSRMGCFGDGADRPRGDLARRIGSFADGLAHQPSAASTTRIGKFSDGLARFDPDEADERRHVESRIAA
jgi:hypothetical protein